MIVLSLPMAVAASAQPLCGLVAAALFLLGWALQFLGHAIERKPPEFLRDPRFLLVGLRWWWNKLVER